MGIVTMRSSLRDSGTSGAFLAGLSEELVAKVSGRFGRASLGKWEVG